MAITGPKTILPRSIGGVARTAGPAAGVPAGQSLSNDALSVANRQLSDYRFTRTAAALMRTLFAGDGMVSSAVIGMTALADSGYVLKAYEPFTMESSVPGLLAAETVLASLSSGWDYSKNFDQRVGIGRLIETALLEVCLTGGVVAELVLDKSRLPTDLKLTPYDQIKWTSDGKGGAYPIQKPTSGDEIPLNYPTIFVAESEKQALVKYASPIMASGAKSLFALSSYIEDMQRVVRQSGQSRLVAQLDYDKILRSAPADIAGDEEKLSTYLDTVRRGVESLLSGLNPQDAIVAFDLALISHLKSDGEKADYATLLDTLSGATASALKSNPSMLGLRLGGSQQTSSTEALIATKIARRYQIPVEEVFSKAITLAVRLLGIDVAVSFEFKPIQLRPLSELAANFSITQNNTLEKLSLGRISDQEAQIEMGLGSLPAGSELLSGTGFYSNKAPDTTPVAASNATNMALAPQTGPDGASTSAGGKDNTQRP